MCAPGKKLVGKVDKDNLSWLPLWGHLKDTAEVMERLVEKWVSDSVIAGCNITYDVFLKTAIFLAAVHDIGKATSYFQNLITSNTAVLRDAILSSGLVVRETIHKGKTPHAFAGYWILCSDSVGINLNKSVANVVGAHHGKPLSGPSTLGEMDMIKLWPGNFYGEEDNDKQKRLWQSLWKSIVEAGLNESGFRSVDELPELTVNAQVLLSGLLIVADWIASNTRLYPLINFTENLEESDYPERVENGWRMLKFPEIWDSEIYLMNETVFLKQFGFEPNEIQRAVYEVVNDVTEPGIIVLEAQMGAGKTEAALSAVEVLAAKCHSKGVFFGLPTQATSNALYNRLYAWATAIPDETKTRKAIELAHGGAVYNSDYQEQIIQGKAIVNDVDDNDDYTDTGAYIHPWFQGGKRALLSDFVVGTVDQFLMASLKRKHFMLRHLGLVGKIVVIDECHAYDTYMNRYLDKTLEWMAGYGVPVILLSATLPLKRREELVDSYLKGRRKLPGGRRKTKATTEMNAWKHETSYPLLTWTDGDSVKQTSIQQNIVNRDIHISHLTTSGEVVKTLRDKLQDGGCACLIANTVKSAQEYYKLIKESCLEADVMLYHAHFTMEDRGEKEKIILERLGKRSKNGDRYKFILVGTQVLEQSLDYDVDLMMTEPCPMDLFIQRIGRLHRHRRDGESDDYSRPEKLRRPECYIIHDNENLYDSGSANVYGEYLLMRTLNIMPAQMSIPRDIPLYVQRIYCEDDDCGLTEKNGLYSKAKEKFYLEENNKKINGQAFLLEKPGSRRGIRGMLDSEYSGSEKNGSQGVRDIGLTIEVLLMKRLDDNRATYLKIGNGKSESVAMMSVPNAKDGLDIARQRVYLPSLFSSAWMWREVIRELESRQTELAAWQNSSWLRGELVLLLDTEQSAELCGYRLHYDFETGLEYKKEEV